MATSSASPLILENETAAGGLTDARQSAPTRHIPDDVEIRALLAALKPPVLEAQANPEEEDNAEARRRERNCSRRDRGSS